MRRVFPAGVQAGKSVDVVSVEPFTTWPMKVWCPETRLQVTPLEKKGHFRIAADEKLLPGVYWWRAYNSDGATGPVPFIVDRLPEIVEQEPNSEPNTAQAVTLPAIVNGQLKTAGDVDNFIVELNGGETLTASLQAYQNLGSPMDGLLQICELVERKPSSKIDKSPQIEAYVLQQAHDVRGLDPLIVWKVPRAGKYLVRVFAFPDSPGRDIEFAGGERFVYRLTLTTGGLVDYAFPVASTLNTDALLAAAANQWPAEFEVYSADENSPPAPGILSQSVDSPDVLTFHADGLAGYVRLSRVPLPRQIENDDASAELGQLVTSPALIHARLDAPRQVDTFRFAAKKNKKLSIGVNSAGPSQQVAAVLRILDQQGAEVVQANLKKKTLMSSIDFTAPADGEYRVQVRDLHQRGGSRFVYQLSIAPVVPSITAKLAGESFVITAGSTLTIPISLQRAGGFNKTVRFIPNGLPAGVSFGPCVASNKGKPSTAVNLVIKATADAAGWQGPISIAGLDENGKTLAVASYDLKRPGIAGRIDPWLTVRLKEKQ
ncbi:MAG: PPC domain-containing protein [Planctomycetota bacterium]|nr:PPC domain-containing protein [Planctomycetota bacterium]